MVHKYRVYKDPFPHPALRWRVINKLLSLAMAIAQLTHLHISIPASGALPGAVPQDCFPSVQLSRVSADSRQVSFASAITILGAEPDSEQSPERVPVDRPTIQIHDPACPDIPEEDDMDVSSEVSDVPMAVLPPPPGFEQFSLPTAVGWGGDPSLFDFSAELPKWFHGGWAGHSHDPPSLPISPILSDTPDDSLLRMLALPEMSRIRRPCLMSCRTLLRDRLHPMCHDQCRSRLPRLCPIFWII